MRIIKNDEWEHDIHKLFLFLKNSIQNIIK
jgi:hypothetical protein